VARVNHSHIVPAVYLRQFADSDRRIETTLVPSGKVVRPSIRDAGVRGGGFYKRERPSGERCDDVETVSIASIEADAGPLLGDLKAAWPLSGDNKVKLAMFAGLQLLRGPRWFAWHRSFTEAAYADYRKRGEFEPKPGQEDATEEEIYQANVTHMLSSTQALMKMLHLTAKAASSLGSMNWALVEFARPLLATCDHPVVAWPASDLGRTPAPVRPSSVGLVNFLEVRLPISPWLGLIMTWRNQPDVPEPLRGRKPHARNFNAFTIAEADEQWFCLPDSKPPIGTGRLLPLAPQLVDRGYGSIAAARAGIRRQIEADLQGQVGNPTLKTEIHYVPQPEEGRADALVRRPS
jgi:hypothetical protein